MTVFSVQAKLPLQQYIRLVGGAEELGNWSPFESIELQSLPGDCSCYRTWSINVNIKDKENVSFRYLVCENIKGSIPKAFSIIKCGPRQEFSVLDAVKDVILDINDSTWCDGWLLFEIEVHLTVHNADGFPIHFFNAKSLSESDSYRIRVTMMDITESCSSGRNDASGVLIKVIGEYYCTVEDQEESGVVYDPLKHYSFVARVLDLKNTIFKIEIYLGDDKTEGNVRIVGKGFIKPGDLSGSCSIINVGLVKDEHPVGSVQVEYLIMKPMEDKHLHNIEDWSDRNWQNLGRTLNMGHRGCGSTFGSARNGLQENTIESFLMACEKGADGVELDVHVTKDLQPVIYHDLRIKVLFQSKTETNYWRMIPVFELTYQELQELLIIHTDSVELNKELLRRKESSKKLFPTLQEVLNALPENFPLELEIKYLETEKDQKDEDFLDANLYVDTLLKAVLESIGRRKIILMSFSPVIVQLLSRKQKEVPVKIGVCGKTEKYPVYRDCRIRTLGNAIAFAESERILGVSCLCDHIIGNHEILNELQRRNLVLSTWGVDDNKEEIRKIQREMGVNVLCFDRIDEANLV